MIATVTASEGAGKVYISVNGLVIGTEEPTNLPLAYVTNFGWIPDTEGDVVITASTSNAGAGWLQLANRLRKNLYPAIHLNLHPLQPKYLFQYL